MTGSNRFADLLAPLAGTFENHVVWAVGAILETRALVQEPFRILEAAPAGSTLYCLIPNSNPDYLAQLAVGLEKEELADLFPAEVEPRLRLDALGELANVVAGLLMADEAFMRGFGHLKPSTPFYSEGAFTDRRDIGIRGAVLANGRRMVFHITVRPAGEGA